MTGTGHPDRRLSLLIVDDHRMFADVLAMRLEREPGVGEVRCAYGLDEGRAVARRMRPDVLLLDYDLGAGSHGTALIAELHGDQDAPPVLMLSASEESADIIEALQCGAAGWIVKDEPVELLMVAVDEVLRGRTFLSPPVVRTVIDELLGRERARATPSFVDSLSTRQLEVLQCLVGGLTRAETAKRLFITVNTVRTHVQNLLQASGEHSTIALVARSRELGVRGIDDPPGMPTSR